MRKSKNTFLKISLIVLLSFCISGRVEASGDFVWAKRMGGTGYDSTYSIQTDSSGNVYTTGYFEGTADFDPGAGTTNLTSAGSGDIFISKLDSSGDFVWAKRMGGTGNDWGQSIQIDSSGNIYTTGIFAGTADFDPGADTSNLTSAGSDDIFISKLDSAGDFVWAKRMGGTGYDSGNSIQVDSSGNVYTTGYFAGTADFDPGAGTTNLTSAGSGDIFISKLDSAGDFVWAKRIGGTGSDSAISIQTGSSGNVYTTGYFAGTVDFDPGAGTSNLTSAGSSDIFISKLDSSGDFVWAKGMGGTGYDSTYSIQVDSSGNVYTTGYFAGTADFDPGAGTSNLTSTGSDDIFISKLDSSGNFVWAKIMGGTGGDYGYSIQTDSSGNIYTSGWFQGTADFDPGAGTANLTSAGSDDIFISKLDSSGDFVWVKGMGGTSGDYPYSMQIDSSENIYTTGYFAGTADFDPGADTSNLTSAGSDDIFILKLSQIEAPTITTSPASSISRTTAVLTGNIGATGGEANTIRGFDIGLDTGYTMSDITESGSHSTGSYSLTATSLNCNTTYHYRAYSTNTAGTATGSDDVFTTESCPSTSGSSAKSRVKSLVSMGKTQEAQDIVNRFPDAIQGTITQTTSIPTSTTCNISGITRTLRMGSKGEDVRTLQKFLNCTGFLIASTGPGSPGNETSLFSTRTHNAVVKFQEHYRSDILTPLNLTKGTGVFGELSRRRAGEVGRNLTP